MVGPLSSLSAEDAAAAEAAHPPPKGVAWISERPQVWSQLCCLEAFTLSVEPSVAGFADSVGKDHKAWAKVRQA